MAASDLQAVVPLAAQLGYKSSLEELESRFLYLAGDESTGLFVGVSEENLVIAFMQLQESSSLMTGPRAELNAIVVDQSVRGRGLGKQMMKVAEDWVRLRRLPKVRLGSRTSRKDTHEFYKKSGFTVEKEWFVFSKPVS